MTIYGIFAILVILLVWVYLFWLIVLVGAVITFRLTECALRHWVYVQRQFTGSGFANAIGCLGVLERARNEGKGYLKSSDFTMALHNSLSGYLTILIQLEF